MKTNVLKLSLIFMTLTILFNCSSDDDSVAIDVPEISFVSTTMEVVFFQSGNSAAPNIAWNGEQGTISLGSSINGLSIDSSTGVLSWTKTLAPGSHQVQVIAANSAGQTTFNITINNPIQGIFTGTYDITEFFEIEFNADGSAIVRCCDVSNPSESMFAEWSYNNGTLLVNYSYGNATTPDYSTSGMITQTASSVVYSGAWFSAADADPLSEVGTIEVELN